MTAWQRSQSLEGEMEWVSGIRGMTGVEEEGVMEKQEPRVAELEEQPEVAMKS